MIAKEELTEMPLNTIQYRHIVATRIQERIDDDEDRRRLHAEINQSQETAVKRYRMQTRYRSKAYLEMIERILEADD